ncbi:MAG: TetR/AcrR family transcriptional regulator [Bacteroidota bacterium]
MEKLSNEKRMEILKAAIDLFSENGFERTTVDEIAARANVGKGTIYLYFANKEQIFIAIIESGVQYILNRMNEILNQPGDFRERLQDLLRQHLQFAENHRKFYRLFIKEGLNLKLIGDKDSQVRILEMHKKAHQQLTEFMQIGIDQNQLRNGDPDIFAFAFSGILSHFCFHWLTERENDSLVEQMPVILDLFYNGVGKKE